MAMLKRTKRDVKPDAPAHTPGIRQGNDPAAYAKQTGHLEDGSSTAARSTGINAEARNPIDPRMPNLSPA
jgi:hypothetical protein